MKNRSKIDIFWIIFLPLVTILIIVASFTGIIDGKTLMATEPSLATRQAELEKNIIAKGYTISEPNIILDPYDNSPLTAVIAFNFFAAVNRIHI